MATVHYVLLSFETSDPATIATETRTPQWHTFAFYGYNRHGDSSFLPCHDQAECIIRSARGYRPLSVLPQQVVDIIATGEVVVLNA